MLPVRAHFTFPSFNPRPHALGVDSNQINSRSLLDVGSVILLNRCITGPERQAFKKIMASDAVCILNSCKQKLEVKKIKTLLLLVV